MLKNIEKQMPDSTPSVQTERWLVLAPHLVFPTTNGADILVDRLAKGVSIFGRTVTVLAASEVVVYSNGSIISRESFENGFRKKSIAALRAILFQTHYLSEKFNTKRYKDQLKQYIGNDTFDTIGISFISTLPLLPIEMTGVKRTLVLTHNDEVKWFTNIISSTKNSLIKMACRTSISSAVKWTNTYLRNVKYVHVTQEDLHGFKDFSPGHHGIVSNIGADILSPEDYHYRQTSERVILSFVGSLNVKMNEDALNNFEKHFYPKLQQEVGGRLVIRIIGSNPSKNVVKLASANKWELHQNVSDEELSELLSQSTFGILPFGYSTGAKLKQLTYLGNGLPFLATECVSRNSEIPPYCLISDSPEQWAEHVRSYVPSPDNNVALLEYSKKYSWKSVAENLLQSI